MEERTGWSHVVEGILRGVSHEMNNRLLALMGVRELVEDGLDADLARLFDDELARLEDAVRLLRKLGERPDAPDLVDPEAILSAVRALHARNATARPVTTRWEVAGGLPAVHASLVLAQRGLLQILASSAEAARTAGSDVDVSVARAGRGIVVEIGPAPRGDAGWPELETAGASVTRSDAEVRVLFAPV